MTWQLVTFNAEGPGGYAAPAIADVQGDNAVTLVVLSENTTQGLEAGALAFKHNVPRGTETGSFS